MATTHTSGTLQTSASNAAGSSTTSTTLDNTTGYGAIITAKVTNGSSAPGAGATATVNVSPDGSTFYFWAAQTAGVSASTAYSMAFDVPLHAIKAQVVFSGNTTNAVTVEAQYQQTTAV
jgi:hypothetical protein